MENGLPLGLSADTTYAESSFQLVPGEQLTLLTDGVPEARDKAGALFGFERFGCAQHPIGRSHCLRGTGIWTGRRHYRTDLVLCGRSGFRLRPLRPASSTRESEPSASGFGTW